jgi:hypothetical protein
MQLDEVACRLDTVNAFDGHEVIAVCLPYDYSFRPAMLLKLNQRPQLLGERFGMLKRIRSLSKGFNR